VFELAADRRRALFAIPRVATAFGQPSVPQSPSSSSRG
jgi:hypothetical protein